MIKSYLHKNLISKCDFFLGISYELKKTFYDKIDVPFLDMPMGVDFDYIPNLDTSKNTNDGIVKFVYVGAIDKLREFDTVVSGFTDSKTAFELPKTELSGTFGQINSQAQDKNFGISQSFNPFQISAKRSLLKEYSNASATKLGVAKQEITYSIRP